MWSKMWKFFRYHRLSFLFQILEGYLVTTNIRPQLISFDNCYQTEKVTTHARRQLVSDWNQINQRVLYNVGDLITIRHHLFHSPCWQKMLKFHLLSSWHWSHQLNKFKNCQHTNWIGVSSTQKSCMLKREWTCESLNKTNYISNCHKLDKSNSNFQNDQNLPLASCNN